MLDSILDLCTLPGAFIALLSWKKFSLSAFKIVKRLKGSRVSPMTIIDVGANVGQFSVAASKEFPQAYIFPIEPDPQTVLKLRKNLPSRISQNVINTAVGECEGTVAFNINVDSQVSSILPLGTDRKNCFPESIVLRQIEVPLATLDSLFCEASLSEPILLKIDVQGYEEQVISGAARFLRRVNWIVMEVSFVCLYEGEQSLSVLIDMMASHGFRFVRPLNFHHVGEYRDIIEMDALFQRI